MAAAPTGKYNPEVPILPGTDLNTLDDGTIIHLDQGSTKNAHEIRKIGNDPKTGIAIFTEKLQGRPIRTFTGFNPSSPSGKGKDYTPGTKETPQGGPIPMAISESAKKSLTTTGLDQNCHNYQKDLSQKIQEKLSTPTTSTTPTTSGGP